jgi:hypothetical protein
MGLKEDIELSLERLRIEKEIAQQVERQTKSVGSYIQARKEVKKNAKEIKQLEETIKQINDEINKKKAAGIKLTKKEQELADQTLAKLQQQRDQLVATNKELISAGNALKSIGNSLISTTKSLIPSLSSVISTVLDLDDKLRNTAATIGLSGAGFDALKNSSEELRESGVRWGFGLNYGIQATAALNQATGRAVILSNEVGEQMAMTARSVGMTAEEFGGLAGQMEAFGLGAGQSAKMISNIQSMSENMGVNSGKVIKKFQDNLGMLNKLNFRGGMSSMAKMAAHSEKFKLSMESVASVSDKVFRPEGAIEAAAQLQVMGGAMSQLGDPFQLMYQARNAPEELAKSITKAARSSATFNKKTGEFEMSAHELDRLRESAKALGMDYGELVQTAKQAAKIDYFEQYLGGMSDEEKGLISGMATMSEKGAEITFYDEKMKKTQTKLLGELTSAEKKMITERAKSDKERANQAMSISTIWQSIQDALMLVGVEVLQPIADFLKSEEGGKWLDNIKEAILGFAVSVRNFFKDLNWEDIKKSLKSFWEKLVWVGNWWKEILIGVLILRFSGVMKGLFSLFSGMIKGLFSLGGPVGKFFTSMFSKGGGLSNMVQSKSGKMYDANSPQGKMIRTKGGTQPLGQQAGQMGESTSMNAGNMIKGAAAMLILSAALFVFAKSLQEFDKLENGWETLAMAGVSLIGLSLGLWALSSIPSGQLIEGAIALAIMGASFIPLAFGLSLLQGLDWKHLGMAAAALVGLSLAIIGLGAIMMSGFGAIAIGLGSAALIGMGFALTIFGFGLQQVVKPISQFTESMDKMFTLDFDKAVTDIEKVGSAIRTLNKDLFILNLLNMNSSIKIEFGEIHVDGEIGLRGQGGAKADSDLLNDPIFLRELKKVIAEHTYRDKKGGR